MFLRISILIFRLLGRLFGFEGLIDHGADEVVEAEIAFRGVEGFVYRGLRVGTGAVSGRQLGYVTLAVVGEQREGFLFGEVLFKGSYSDAPALRSANSLRLRFTSRSDAL